MLKILIYRGTSASIVNSIVKQVSPRLAAGQVGPLGGESFPHAVRPEALNG